MGELRLDPAVVGLSDAYELCRQLEGDWAAAGAKGAQWVPPDKFERVTRSEWEGTQQAA